MKNQANSITFIIFSTPSLLFCMTAPCCGYMCRFVCQLYSVPVECRGVKKKTDKIWIGDVSMQKKNRKKCQFYGFNLIFCSSYSIENLKQIKVFIKCEKNASQSLCYWNLLLEFWYYLCFLYPQFPYIKYEIIVVLQPQSR